MGQGARKLRHAVTREAANAGDTPLEDSDVLELLELPKPQDDDFNPARGIGYGILFGAALWALIILAWLLAF